MIFAITPIFKQIDLWVKTSENHKKHIINNEINRLFSVVYINSMKHIFLCLS
ncbi:MAG: hypothetical protein BWY27_01227 [Bacteroidetes bacterium ADurb.Bin234]|jgi:hypothetical protein|nr:MAG: hypothetical protein BWY27_01227 [Bacteroidetes bacterium ADurb.Bin234]